MPTLWSPRLAIGVPDIDRQHVVILERADQLLEALRAGRGAEQVAGLLAFLTDYVAQHFAEEERLMERHHYYGLAVHKEMHDDLRKDLSDLGARFLAAGAPTSAIILGLNNLVSGWLVNHISTVDVKLAALVDERERIRP